MFELLKPLTLLKDFHYPFIKCPQKDQLEFIKVFLLQLGLGAVLSSVSCICLVEFL